MNSNPQRAEHVFNQALDFRPEERPAFLAGACGDDIALRQRVEALLAAHEKAAGFLPAEGGQTTVISTHVETARPIVKPDLADAPDEAIGTHVGRYKLLEKVGEGGCGAVYVAEQTEPVRRRVALKVIKLGMDTKQVVARFEAERQALAMMDHPNIAKVLDAGTTDVGRPFFVMELVRGIKITDYCDQANLTTKERLDLFIKVCQAIQHAHQKGIIHRDIKPSNILVTLHDGVPVPKVIDFGIAKATEGRLTDATVYTQLHQFIGTPAYMSPEQAEMSGLDIDTRSDIYSLGVLLYEVLTGKTPFDAKELMASGIDAMRKTIREKEPVRPSTRLATLGADELTTTAKRRSADTSKLLHQLKGDLDWIVMKCLEKDRQRRYETANGLAADLKRHLSNEPVVARPPSAAYKLQKAWRRNKIAFTAGAVVAVALIVGISVSLWQATVATAARNDADDARLKEKDQRLAAQAAQAKAEAERNRAETQKRENRLRAYVAEISAAFHALDENNLGRAIELRDHWLPKPGEDDLRGFEWRLLWKLCQSDAKDSLSEGAGSIRFSPDGKWLACYASGRIVIRAWPSRKVVKEIPFADAWLDFSHDSKLLAGAHDGELELWSTETWQEVKTVKSPGGISNPVVFSPQGKWLVTGAKKKGYRVWDTDTWEGGPPFGDDLLRKWVANTAVAFSPDGTLLVTAGHPDGRESGNQFQVWDFPSLKPRSNFEPFPGRLSSAAFAADGKHLLTGTGEGMLLVWNVAAGRIVERINAHTGWFWSIATARDVGAFATCSADRTVVLWDAATYKSLVRMRGHVGQIRSMAMSPDGGTLVSSSDDGTMKFWDARTRHAQLELPGCQYAVGFSADSQRLVGAGYTKAVLWNLEDGATRNIPLQDYDKLLKNRGYMDIVSTSRDANGNQPLAAFGLTDGAVEIWDTATMNRISAWGIGEGDVRAVTFAPGCQLLATGDDKGQAALWEIRPHREVRRFEPLQAPLRCLTFSPDGKLLAASDNNSSLNLWEVATGRLLQKRKLEGIALSVAFSPDGGLLLTGEVNETGKIWEVPSLEPRGALKGHVEPLFGSFSPDGRTIATVSDDCNLKLWNVATQQEMVTFALPGGGRSAKFSRDGLRMAIGYLVEPKEFIRLWTVPSIEEIDSKQMANGQP